MNILFLTMSPQLLKVEASGIYNDLVRKFIAEGHSVYVMAPLERRNKQKTTMCKQCGVNVLEVWTLNVTRANVVEKGVGQLLLESQFKSALKKYLKDVKFNVILYSTPPITFSKVIEYAKRMNPQAVSYLMLKDIFPQNAVDINMLRTSGIKGFLYRSFRKKEERLYKLSDYIGCMSPANVEYLKKHNPQINPSIVEICPNSYDVTTPESLSANEKIEIRRKYNLPKDKPIYIYGGNLGKPQGVPFLVECLKAVKDRTDCHFVVIGSGTDYALLDNFVKEESPASVSLFSSIPKEDYERLADACDVGLIFLDYRFTIPNFPSRMLSYIMNKKPYIAVTDPNSDVGPIAEANGFGYWAPSNSVEAFVAAVNKMQQSDISEMGERGYRFYLDNYTVEHTYKSIIKHLSNV